jgi:hypothetical protein
MDNPIKVLLIRPRATLAILAVAAVVAAVALLYVLPVYQTSSCSQTTGQTRTCTSEKRTLVEESDGAGVFLLITVLVVSGGAAASFVRHPLTDAVTWTVVVVSLLFCLGTGFSIGLFFVPAAGLLLATALAKA